MKTLSSDYLKEIKASMKQVREALKQIEESENLQDQARNCRDYDRAKNEAADATLSMMQALEEAIRLTSAIGSCNGLYDIHKYHKVVELDFRDSHK